MGWGSLEVAFAWVGLGWGRVGYRQRVMSYELC